MLAKRLGTRRSTGKHRLARPLGLALARFRSLSCAIMRLPASASLLSILLAGALSGIGACGGGGGGARSPVQCGAEARVQLNCESEFKYEGRNVEGGFEALGVGSISAKTDEVALRQIDQQTEQYAAQARRLCDEYNSCVVDKETYSTRSENLRRRMSKVPELYDGLKAATDPDARKEALANAYQALVPDEERRELSLELDVRAKKPDQADAFVLGAGSSLPTNTRVSFSLKVSRPAYVYLFQKSPDGTLNVLFPDQRIPLKNPIAASADLRIPAGDASFRLNEKDIGTERVYVVASLEPLASFGQSADRVAAGQKADGQLASVSQIPQNKSGCKQRALELDEDSASPCVRSRGLELDDGAGPGASAEKSSLRARTEAADGVLVQVFSFEHTP